MSKYFSINPSARETLFDIENQENRNCRSSLTHPKQTSSRAVDDYKEMQLSM